MVDHDHPLAQRHHVGHVVAGEQHGGALALVVLGEEAADAALHGDVQPQGGLVQEQHSRAVHQRPGDLHLHALAQRQVADRLLDQVLQLQQLDELIPRALVGLRVQVIYRLEQLVGIDGRDIPHQLVALPGHQGDLAQIVVLPLVGQVAEHPGFAAGWVEQTGEHLERGGLAGAVGPQEPYHLSRLHLEADRSDRPHVFLLAADEALERGHQPGRALGNSIRLGEVLDLDG